MMSANRDTQSFFTGCLLGGAIGDALGYPVEFMKREAILAQYGPQGITDLVLDPNLKAALISDDTQMTLFSADGILVAAQSPDVSDPQHFTISTYHAFQRWLFTQTSARPGHLPATVLESDILNERRLYASREPGITTMTSLRRHQGQLYGTLETPINDSKGCGGVMRVAPVGLFWNHDPALAFRFGCMNAALTHGHPSGYLSAGFLAALIAFIIQGRSIHDAIAESIKLLKGYDKHDECLGKIEQALHLAGQQQLEPPTAIAALGGGWVGEEALAIALYCVLTNPDNCRQALIMAVNHDGDSDSTGSITGNILGAYYGLEALPPAWCQKVELANFIKNMAGRLYLKRPGAARQEAKANPV
jgi:ADP-ribosylglycohydrolase